MSLTEALILINSHGITPNLTEDINIVVNIPCFSVCFRGELEVNGEDIT